MTYNRFIFLIYSWFIPLFINAQDFEWAKPVSGNSVKEASCITADVNGSVITSGIFNGTLDADPTTATALFNSNGDYDVFVQKLDKDGNYLWCQTFGGNGYDNIFSLTTDVSGNIYLSGLFLNTVDFDPGPGVYNQTAAVGSIGDTYLLKLDSSGNFVSVLTWQGGYPYSIITDDSQNVYMTGDFDGEFDADPGPGIFTLTADGTGGGASSFIIKISPSGSKVWANNPQCNISNIAGANSIALDGLGNLYTTGWFQDSVDFDPGAGVSYLAAVGTRATVIQKMDTSGNFIWAKSLVSDDYATGNDITVGTDGNIYSLGMFGGYLDIDPGPATVTLTNPFNVDYYILALDPSGNYNWSYQIDINDADYSGGIEQDTSGNIFVHGYFNGYYDFDPGPAYVSPNINTLSGRAVFILKLNSNGTYSDVFAYGGDLPMFWGDAFDLDSAGNIYSTALFYEELDFDPGADVFLVEPEIMPDIIVHKLAQITCSNMYTIIDSMSMISCASGNGYANVLAAGGTAPYSYSWNTVPVTAMSSVLVSEPGVYTVTVTDNVGCIRESRVVVNGPRTDQTGNVDLVIDMASTDVVPGANGILWLDAYNAGCVPASGEITLKLSAEVDFVNAVPFPDYVSADTLKWNFSNLTSDSLHRTLRVEFLTHLDAQPTRRTCFNATITPFTGDIDTLNNRSEYCLEILSVSASVSKVTVPLGECYNHYVSLDQKLTYVLRFQNTGSDTVVNVSIMDEVDYSLDINTVNLVSSSHYVIPEIVPGNYLSFRFDSIMLPDGQTDLPGSYGYVIYEIDPLPTITNGTAVQSQATFTFDSSNVITTGLLTYLTFVATVPNPQYTQNITLCYGDSLLVDNHYYSIPGTYTDILITSEGCDSTLTTILNFYPLTDTIVNPELCYGETFTVGSSVYTNSGNYLDTLITVHGCDSIISTNLIVKSEILSTQNFVICPGDSVLVDTIYFGAQGTFPIVYPAADGCDSTVYVNISLYPSSSFQNVDLCFGESYTFNGNTYSTTGIYSDTLISSFGCDSVITTNLTLNSQIDVSVSVDLQYVITAGNAFANLYQWISCISLLPVSGETNQSFPGAVYGEGSYAVIVTEGACSDTSACVVINRVDENYFNVSKYKIYPNPNNGQFKVGGLSEGEIKIYNVSGELVYFSKSEAGKRLMINNISPGIYTLMVLENGAVSYLKFAVVD